MKVITGLPADKNFKKNFVCHPSCLALSLDQHFPICFTCSWATRTIVDRPNLSINRTMQLHSTHHACVIGQYASFACAGVVGQLHLNGFLFSCISIDKKQTELLLLIAKTFKLDGYFFSDFVIVLINW